MTSDDLKRIFLGSTLFRLDAILSPKLVPLIYVVGLLGLLIWGVEHLFATFGANFGTGLWGLLEIAVYGSLALLLLRVLCELLLIYFKANEETAEILSHARVSTSLLEEVRDAIHDIADEDDEELDVDDLITPATVPVPDVDAPSATTRMPRRTARRTPGPRR